MGTFLDFYGKQEIQKEKLQEYIDRVCKILKYGGMIQFEQVKLFNKEINLIKVPEPDENGMIYFHYNTFEDDAWETAYFDTTNGYFRTNKVGWAEFNWVCSAVNILSEFYNTTFCITGENGDIEDGRQIIGWLNYLFNENYTNKRFYDFWKIYEVSHNITQTNLSSLLNYIDNENNLSLSSLVSYAYIDKDNVLWEQFSKIKPEEGTFNIINCMKKSENYIKKFKKDGKTFDELIEFLLKDTEEIKSISLKDNEESAIFAFDIMILPQVIILKQICENYERDFWKEYDKIKEKIDFSRGNIWDKEEENEKINKISTKDFLDTPDNSLFYWHTKFSNNYHKTDDDFCYFWDENSEYEFTEEFKKWVKELKEDFNNINNENNELISESNFIKKMIDLLKSAEEQYERIFAYKEMFYEFLTNSQIKEYQTALILFEKVLKDNTELGAVIKERSSWDITDRNILFNQGRLHVKRYLEIMANKELRKKIFNF